MTGRGRSAALGAALAMGVACGGGQTRASMFSTDWEDDGGASIARVWQRMGATPIPPSADLVVGVAGNSDKLIAAPLGTTGAKWTFAHPLDARPVITGNVVVGSGGGEVFALDAKAGSLLWRRPTGDLPLLGAGDDGMVTVVTFRKAGGLGDVLLAVAHDGQMVRQIETDKPLGAPAALAGLAFVPWAGEYVSVIDLANGDEAARITVRELTSRAWIQGGSLWFGELGFIRFDEHIKDASRGRATTVTLPARDLPGTPQLMPSGERALPPAADATDKVHIYARPRATDTGAGLEDQRWVATYFRVAMGFDADQGTLAWARLSDADFVGGAAAVGGVVLCDEQGRIVELEARNGGVVGQMDLGEPVKACIVNANDHRITGTPTAIKSLPEQLSEVVMADDPQLGAAQRLLLRDLAKADDEIATRTLVDLASDPRTSPDLLRDARIALAKRRNGAQYMEAALARHYDFLKDVLRAPPVGPIAQALGAMKDRKASALLASHLLDPADTDDDVKQAAAALAVVAGPEQLPSLRQFFGMYRASAPNDDIATALVSTGQALVMLEDSARVAAAAKDESTVPFAREPLEALVASPTGNPAATAGRATVGKKK
jgi:outer membrane protein assembly factor BamB